MAPHLQQMLADALDAAKTLKDLTAAKLALQADQEKMAREQQLEQQETVRMLEARTDSLEAQGTQMSAISASLNDMVVKTVEELFATHSRLQHKMWAMSVDNGKFEDCREKMDEQLRVVSERTDQVEATVGNVLFTPWSEFRSKRSSSQGTGSRKSGNNSLPQTQTQIGDLNPIWMDRVEKGQVLTEEVENASSQLPGARKLSDADSVLSVEELEHAPQSPSGKTADDTETDTEVAALSGEDASETELVLAAAASNVSTADGPLLSALVRALGPGLVSRARQLDLAIRQRLEHLQQSVWALEGDMWDLRAEQDELREMLSQSSQKEMAKLDAVNAGLKAQLTAAMEAKQKLSWGLKSYTVAGETQAAGVDIDHDKLKLENEAWKATMHHMGAAVEQRNLVIRK